MIRRPPRSTLFPSTPPFRSHIRVDVWVNRLPLRLRAVLHLVSLLLLGGFAVFCAWAAAALVDESLLFDAHDNSADRKSTRLNSSHANISYAGFCLNKKQGAI